MLNIILIIVLVLLISTLNIVCFFIGAKVGQKVVHNEVLEAPKPVQAIKDSIKEHEIERQIEKENEYYNTIAHNIDTYDGSSIGQLEIPR